MAGDQIHTTRKKLQLRVPVLSTEAHEIRRLAEAAGLSVASYLRTVGLGYRVTGTLDYESVGELAKVNGDLGRLGGLLKLWLTDDPRTAAFGEATIRALLGKIEDTQSLMRDIMHSIVLPRGER